MLLGQVIERLVDEGFASETLLALGDLPLLVDVEAAGRKEGISAAVYAAAAARRFASQAADDDWLALMTALERADDPGTACLQQMLVWSLRLDAAEPSCGCGSNCRGEEHV